jgi:outer membrane lipoprotein-sorting protein
MSSLPHFRLLPVVLLFGAAISYGSEEASQETWTILKRMEDAYALVKDYRAKMEVRTYRENGSFETDRFVYTFKKPKSIRLDFETPHPGMVLIYPDKDGKAVIRPSGLAHFLKLHLAPDNPLLRVSAGQSVDKTDLGLLIENIRHSLTDQSRGRPEVSTENGYIRIHVLALNHFRPLTITLYDFFVDETLWLPTKVVESDPHGRLERTVTFESLRVNAGVSDDAFRLDEKKEGGYGPAHGK